jgi:hypothetical protein
MRAPQQRHTLTLDRDVVRRIDRLRKSQSLSSFVNDALVAYSAEVERRMFKETPVCGEEASWAGTSAALFVGDDNEDWDALFGGTPQLPPRSNP